MPAVVRPRFIFSPRDFGNAGACCCFAPLWSANFGRSKVVYYRIAQISRLNFATASSPCRSPTPPPFGGSRGNNLRGGTGERGSGMAEGEEAMAKEFGELAVKKSIAHT